jgi:hypothetical protein
MRVRFVTAVLVVALVGAACSSGTTDAQQVSSDAGPSATTLQADSVSADAEDESVDATSTTEAEDNVFAAAAAGGASATLTLENGETYTFNILCALEPQESAGQEILFTVVSYDDPVSLDVSQFGAESLGGASVISLYDSATFDNVWEANTLHGGELELALSGDTVVGHGVFLAGEEQNGPGVAGAFEAHC